MRACSRVFVCLLLCSLVACDRAAALDPPNILLISIDTLRPDHLGCYGYDRPTSPVLDRLAADGVTFEDASSPSPWTLPAHASLLTGRYPSRHGVLSHETRLGVDIPTVAEILGQQGYRTAAIVNSHNLSSRYGLERGFTDFLYIREDVAEIGPSAVRQAALDWLAKPQDGPFFLFLHFYDVHSDYRSLPQYEQAFVEPSDSIADGTTAQLSRYRRGLLALDLGDAARLIDLYDAGIRQMDDGLAVVFTALDRAGVTDNTVILVTSDHGEEFLEHQGVLHGRTQFEEVIRIPLIVKGPGIPAGLRVPELTSLLDVSPTLLALAGAPTPANLDGIDLRPLWQEPDAARSARLLYAEADHNNVRHDIKRAVRHTRFKMHYNRMTDEWALYDLENDPGETRDVFVRETEISDVLSTQLKRFMTGVVAREPIEPLSPEDIQKLKSLGYL